MQRQWKRALSSAGERSLHTREVVGSIPTAPTISQLSSSLRCSACGERVHLIRARGSQVQILPLRPALKSKHMDVCHTLGTSLGGDRPCHNAIILFQVSGMAKLPNFRRWQTLRKSCERDVASAPRPELIAAHGADCPLPDLLRNLASPACDKIGSQWDRCGVYYLKPSRSMTPCEPARALRVHAPQWQTL
jgi:hypothetical protein